MQKKKLFYLILLIFFSQMPICHAKMGTFDDLSELEEYNKLQSQNKTNLREYQEQTSDLIAPKTNDYWDLAWHARLADYGDGESQFIIAHAYETGDVIKEDRQKALEFYKKSALNGHLDACIKLGRIYNNNEWLKADIEKSLYWYGLAAQKGHTQAQFKVVELLTQLKEYQKAYDWLKFALTPLFDKGVDLEEKSPQLAALKYQIKVHAK